MPHCQGIQIYIIPEIVNFVKHNKKVHKFNNLKEKNFSIKKIVIVTSLHSVL